MHIKLYSKIQEYLPFFECLLGKSPYIDVSNVNYSKTNYRFYFSKEEAKHVLEYYWDFTKNSEDLIMKNEYLSSVYVEMLVLRGENIRLINIINEIKSKSFNGDFNGELPFNFYKHYDFNNLDDDFINRLLVKKTLNFTEEFILKFFMKTRKLSLKTACNNLENYIELEEIKDLNDLHFNIEKDSHLELNDIIEMQDIMKSYLEKDNVKINTGLIRIFNMYVYNIIKSFNILDYNDVVSTQIDYTKTEDLQATKILNDFIDFLSNNRNINDYLDHVIKIYSINSFNLDKIYYSEEDYIEDSNIAFLFYIYLRKFNKDPKLCDKLLILKII